MDISRYRNRDDYTTELRLHDGSVELVKHCGKCLAVIPRTTCDHCDSQAVKAEHEARRKFLGLDVGQDGTD